ncbi:hypothetical protein ACR8VA_09020, partial [Streptococcus equinus]|uniref:hypothetical protein n=1 Tax=Streptococcus equinus TaxID=1335 RepID=UPI003EECD351
MMKKTFFMRTFNLDLFLILFSICLTILGFSLQLLIQQFQEITFLNLQVLLQIALIGLEYTKIMVITSSVLLILILLVEIFLRLRNDRISNYLKSVYQSFKFRNFLTQREKSEKIITVENQSITTFNPINTSFNKAMSKCLVDVRVDEVRLYIKLPSSQQGQKILKDMEHHIREEISEALTHSDQSTTKTYINTKNTVKQPVGEIVFRNLKK